MFQSQNITINLKRIRQRALTVTGGTGGDGWNDDCARDHWQRCRRRRLRRYWCQRRQLFLDRLLGHCGLNLGHGCCRFCSRLVGLEFWQILDFNLGGGHCPLFIVCLTGLMEPTCSAVQGWTDSCITQSRSDLRAFLELSGSCWHFQIPNSLESSKPVKLTKDVN